MKCIIYGWGVSCNLYFISYINPSPVALFLSTNTAVAELIFKIYLFIPTKIKNS